MRKTLALAAGAAALAFPAAAQASSVSLSSPSDSSRSGVSFFAATGEANAVTVTTNAGNAVVITDPNSTIQTFSSPPGPYSSGQVACDVSADGHTATCTPPAGQLIPTLTAFLGDRDDSFISQAAFPSTPCTDSDSVFCDPSGTTLTAYGDTGDDALSGASTNDSLVGGDGNDALTGNGGDDTLVGDGFSFFSSSGSTPPTGNDSLAGGDGSDSLDPGPGTDTADGGASIDSIAYGLPEPADGSDIPRTTPGATITLNAGAATAGNGLAGENDTIASVEDAFGTVGVDTLVGSDVSNTLQGGPGNDAITGNGAFDLLSGNGGNDAINSRDNGPDRVDCGGDADTVTGDVVDDLLRCPAGQALTAVTTPAPVSVPVPVAVRDTARAKLAKFSVPKSFKVKKLRKSGKVPVSFVPNEDGRAGFDLVGRAKTVSIAKAGDVVLASATKNAKAGKRVKATLKLGKKARKALRRKRSLTLRVTFTDKGGNVTAATRRIKLR